MCTFSLWKCSNAQEIVLHTAGRLQTVEMLWGGEPTLYSGRGNTAFDGPYPTVMRQRYKWREEP